MIKLHTKFILIFMALAGFGGAAIAADSITYTFDDWQVTCPQTEEHTNHCAMSQQGLDQKSGRQVYQMTVSFPKGKAPAQLDVLVPLGVSLQAGVAIEVEKNASSPFKMPYRYCIGSGCLAEVTMNKGMTDAFRHGHKAGIRIQDQNKKDVVLPFSLRGYSSAYSKLITSRKD